MQVVLTITFPANLCPPTWDVLSISAFFFSSDPWLVDLIWSNIVGVSSDELPFVIVVPLLPRFVISMASDKSLS